MSKKKHGSKKGDKKHNKKKSKSSSNTKGKGKTKDKKDKHGGKKVQPPGPMKEPPMMQKPGPPGDVRTPPVEQKMKMNPARQPQPVPMQQGQQGRPMPPQQQRPGPMKPHTPPPPGMGRPAAVPRRSSQSLSAEALGGSDPATRPPQQQPRPIQQGGNGGQQRMAAPAAAPRPPQQHQQRPPQKAQRPSPPSQVTPKQQSSPDQEKTEKRTDRRNGATGKKISKLLDIKFSNVVESHKNNLGKLPPSVSRAAFDDNLCLNRFEDVICIDQTRVLFSDNQMYLNANWVDISKTRKAIIGQLPLPESNVAFWSMIAENDIKGVLALCDDNEFLTFDLHATFPMNKATAQISSRITVTHTHRVAVSSDWTMNVYLLCRGDIRKYVHVHFYSWSGEGVLPLTTLWQLESVFRKYNTAHVYMSSAGVGRAATFAALQMVHCKLHEDSCKAVSLSDCIASLREQRLHSVQSLSQSITIHAALIQHIIDCPAFEKKEKDPRITAFAEQYRNHMATSKE